MDSLLTTAEAARELGITRRHLRHLIMHDHLLPAQKHGRDWMIRFQDLEAVRHRRPVGRPRKAD